MRPDHFAAINAWVVIPGGLLALAAVVLLGAGYLALSVAGSPSAPPLVPYLRMAARVLAVFALAFVIVGLFSVRGG